MEENVNHPKHYGGEDNPYEVIKIIEHYDLPFTLGNAIKYILRAGKKDPSKYHEDIDKAIWYLQRENRKSEAHEGKKDLEESIDDQLDKHDVQYILKGEPILIGYLKHDRDNLLIIGVVRLINISEGFLDIELNYENMALICSVRPIPIDGALITKPFIKKGLRVKGLFEKGEPISTSNIVRFYFNHLDNKLSKIK